MNYESVVAAIQRLIAEAPEERLRAFGAETIVRLAHDTMRPGVVPDGELDDNALLALTDACQRVLTASPSELRGLLSTVDEGVLTDGDMDFPVYNILDALERWTAFLESGRRDELSALAILSLDRVDFHLAEADPSGAVATPPDFLAAPEMAAEFERIRRTLTG